MTNGHAPLRIGDIRSRALLPILIALSVLLAAILLYVTAYMTFFWDEWDFISIGRQWNSSVLFLPHNEHWSTIPILIWKLLFVVVGIRSHIPYEAALLLAHVASVLLMFVLVRGRSGDLPAFAAALTLLLLGSGGTDIVWAFQIGFVGSVAFGLLAMVLLEGDPSFPGRMLAASAALLASLMCSGVGLAFLAAISIELATDPHRRRFLLALVVPAAAFTEWFLSYGAGLPGTPGEPCPSCVATGFSADFYTAGGGLTFLVNLSDFIITGLEACASAIVGLPLFGTALLPLVAVVVVAHWFRQGFIAPWQIGMSVGILVWFALTGLGRVQNGPTAAAESRYIYVGAVFLLPLVCDAVRNAPWQSLGRYALTTAFTLCLVANLVLLSERALTDPNPSLNVYLGASQPDIMRRQIASLQTVEVFRAAPDLALDQSVDEQLMPQLSVKSYLAAVDTYGSPVPKATIKTLQRLPPDLVDRTMVNLFGNAMTVSASVAGNTQGLPCQSVDSTSGSTIALAIRDGESVFLRSSKAGDAFFFLGFLGQPIPRPLQHAGLEPGQFDRVYLPDTGRPIIWRLWIRTTDVGTVKLCGATNIEQNPSVDFVDRAWAAGGRLGAAWSSVSDSAAAAGRAAMAVQGTFSTYQSDLFGAPRLPPPVSYDLWFRVRVEDPSSASPGLTLGLWDREAANWIASSTYRPDQLGRDYALVEVANAISPTPGHDVQFLASFIGTLTTNWFVDDAFMVPTQILNTPRYRGEPESGVYAAAWSSVEDPAASDGRAAKAHGSFNNSQSDVFGVSLVPVHTAYDVWFRVRVSSLAKTGAVVVLGLWDDDTGSWIAYTKYRTSQIGLTYSWINVAPGVTPTIGDHVQFIASFQGSLGTDWFIDTALMVPAGAALVAPRE